MGLRRLSVVSLNQTSPLTNIFGRTIQITAQWKQE